ncbi:MAG: hypothetical protein GXO78_04220 [Calditrichaeota bacterium]|nr:hypothetical protein [Calditrichota bacterium]
MSDLFSNEGTILHCLSLLARPVYHWRRWFPGMSRQQKQRCVQLRQRIRKAFQDYSRHVLTPPRTEVCLDDYAISNYVHGTAEPEAVKSMEQHLETCDWCLLRTWAIQKRNVRLYHQITHAGSDLESPIWASEVPGAGKFVKGVVGFLLIVAIFFLLFFIQKYKAQRGITESGQPIFREEPPASLEIPAAVWEKREAYLHFKWQPVPEAQFYRITIWDAETGKVIVEKQLRESRLAVQVTPHFSPDGQYVWKVEAIAYQRVLRSYPSMSFTLGEN